MISSQNPAFSSTVNSDQSSKTDRKYDVTIFGATGFTGTLITKYLIQRLSNYQHDSILNGRRFCIAGRNESRLNNLVTEHNIKMTEKGLKQCVIDVAVVEKIEKGSAKLLDMTRNTRVLLNVAGPFIACGGLEIVESCVETGTDYLDITGEPEFVLESAQKFHEKAKQNNVKIIHCCGFDSIPSDMGTNVSLNYIRKRLEDDGIINPSTKQEKASFMVTNGYLSVNLPGFVSYGTFNTVVTSLENYSVFSGKKTSEQKVQQKKKTSLSKRGTKFHKDLQTYIIPFSTSDPLIVRRSNFLLGYDNKFSTGDTSTSNFEFNNYLQISNLYYLFIMFIFLIIMFILTRFSFGARFLRFLYSLKQNPTQRERDESSFDYTFETFGSVQDAKTSEQVLVKCKTRVYNNNDPGYTETAVYAMDSALFLLSNSHAQLAPSGVVTTASVFGVENCKDEYLRCLGQRTTLRFEVVDYKTVKKSDNAKDFEELKKNMQQFIKIE